MLADRPSPFTGNPILTTIDYALARIRCAAARSVVFVDRVTRRPSWS